MRPVARGPAGRAPHGTPSRWRVRSGRGRTGLSGHRVFRRREMGAYDQRGPLPREWGARLAPARLPPVVWPTGSGSRMRRSGWMATKKPRTHDVRSPQRAVAMTGAPSSERAVALPAENPASPPSRDVTGSVLWQVFWLGDRPREGAFPRQGRSGVLCPPSSPLTAAGPPRNRTGFPFHALACGRARPEHNMLWLSV